MSKRDISFTWHYDQQDTFDPPPSDQPVTVYADPGSSDPDWPNSYFGKRRGKGFEMTKNAKNYTLVLQPPSGGGGTKWGNFDANNQQTMISIQGGTVVYDTSLDSNSGYEFETIFSSVTIAEGGSLKLGTVGGGALGFDDDNVGGNPSWMLNGNGSFELELNGDAGEHSGRYMLHGTSGMTTSSSFDVHYDGTFTLKDSAKLTGTKRVGATGAVRFTRYSGHSDPLISLRDQATAEFHSDSLGFKQEGEGNFFTLGFADTRLSFLPLTKGAEPFEFGKGKYPKAMFNFIKDSAPLNQSRIFIPGMNLQAAWLRQAMVKDQVLAINGTIVQDTDLFDQKTEAINGHYGTWISLSKKP